MARRFTPALIGLGLLGFASTLGCSGAPGGGGDVVGGEHNRGVIREADERFAFYAGVGTGDAIARGEPIGDDFPSPFMRLRVPSAFVDAAAANANRVHTVTFETPDPTIEATVRYFVGQSRTLQTLYFHPGDPWITGYAQVGTGADDVTMGFFEVIKWNRGAPGMPDVLAQNTHTTGLLKKDDLPPLKYGENPATWPPLPDNWK